MPLRRSTNILPTTPISSSNSSSRRRRPTRPQRELPLTPSPPPSPSLQISSDCSSGPSNTAGEAWSPPPNQTPANPNSRSPLPGSSSTDPTLRTTATDMVRATPSTKKSHAKQRPEGHIPRPKNPFILFRCTRPSLTPSIHSLTWTRSFSLYACDRTARGKYLTWSGLELN